MGPNPGSTGSLLQGRQGWGENADADGACAPVVREINEKRSGYHKAEERIIVKKQE